MRIHVVPLALLVGTLLSVPAAAPATPATATPFDPGTFEVLDSVTHRGTVPARGAIAYRFDPATGAFTLVTERPGRVGTREAAALAATPRWLRADLLTNLERLPDDARAAFLDLVAGLAGDPVVDEVAFLVAHLPPWNLQDEGFDPRVLVEDAAGIYAQAALADYAEIVEVGSPDADDDGYTTLRLRYRDASGADAWEELPRDIYYWYVLHPRLDGEAGGHVDPSQVTIEGDDRLHAPPEGVFWRSYFPDPGAFDVVDYRDHLLWRVVGALTADDLSGWGPSAAGHLGVPDIDPLVLATDPDGAPLVLETRIGRGTVLASTLRVEAAAARGVRKPLWAFLRYGSGNIDFLGRVRTLLVRDPAAGAPPGEVGIVADEMAFLGFPFDTVDADGFAAVTLADYGKILVVEDAPLAVFEALSARTEDVQAWVQAGGMLQIHGATAADWSDLDLPAGVVRVDDVAIDEVVLGGWPGWSDVLAGAAYVWDGTEQSLSGERFLAPDAGVLDRVGYWVSQNLADNVEERGTKMGFPPERAQHAERILVNHYGNCGELQDALTTGARTALIPIRNASNSNEDHVWNQFWHGGVWHTVQVSWSDGGTDIGRRGVCGERLFNENDQGKDISFVSAYRGDGRLLNVTPDYTQTRVLDLTVTDAAGQPVDGAFVLLASETFYDDSLMVGHWDWTDGDGRLSVEVGDRQNIYVRVESPLGSFPPEDGRVTQVIADSEGGPGDVFPLEHAFDGALPEPVLPGPVQSADVGPDAVQLALTVAVEGEYACRQSLCEARQGGKAVVALLDEAGWNALQGGAEQVPALQVEPVSATPGVPAELAAALPEAPWYVVVSAPGRYAFAPFVTLEATAARPLAPPVEDPPTADVVDPSAGDGGGDGDGGGGGDGGGVGVGGGGGDGGGDGDGGGVGGGVGDGGGGGSCAAGGSDSGPPAPLALLALFLGWTWLERRSRPHRARPCGHAPGSFQRRADHDCGRSQSPCARVDHSGM